MNFKSILFFLGFYLLAFSIFTLFNLIFTFYFENSLHIKSYLISFFLSFVIGLFFCFKGKEDRNKLNVYDQIFIVILGFVLIPLFLAIPFFLSVYNFNFIDSYFEAVSGFTSTGMSIFHDLNYIDQPLILWRSSSQWLGGLFFLISIISILGTIKTKIKPLYLTFGLHEEGSYYKYFIRNFISIFIIYFSTTLVIIFLYSIVEMRFFDGFNLSLTVISSGGFLPKNLLSSLLRNDYQTFVLALSFIFPLLNFYIFWKMLSGNLKLRNFIEDFYLLSILIVSTSMIYFFVITDQSIINIFLSTVSSLTTSGINIYDSSYDLSLFLILLTVIGGSAFSTTSGFKFLRIYILLKTSFNEMFKLVKPINIQNRNLFSTSYKITDSDIKISFLVFLFFLVSIFTLSCILSFDNIPFDESFKLSVLTLTNTAPSNMYGIYHSNIFDFNLISKIFLIIFMILAKIEIITVLILIKRFIIKD